MLLFCLPALASVSLQEQRDRQRTLKEFTLEELGEVRVTTAGKMPERLWRTSAAIYVLTREEIRRSGAATIPDMLRLVPGVHVAQVDSNKVAVGIRGFGSRLSRSMLVLIDGRSVYTPLFAGVYWEVQDTLIEDIERIEVIRGPGGTVWGANAVNGIVNIVTRSAHESAGTVVSAGGGSLLQGFVNARYGEVRGRTAYRLYGKGFTRGPHFHPDNANFDDWRLGQFGFRTDWNRTDRESVTLQGDVYRAAAGNRTTVTTFVPPAVTTIMDNNSLAGGNLLGRWRRQLADDSEIQVTAYFDRTARTEINFQETRNTFDLDLLHTFRIPRHDFTWGAGVRASPSRFTQLVPTVEFIPARHTHHIVSGFLHDEIAITPDRLFLQLGTKLEHNNFSGFEYQPSARLLWTPTREQTAWLAVTRAVRTPSRVEDGLELTALASPAVPSFLRVIADGGFDPERVFAYEGGYRAFAAAEVSFDVAVFHNRYQNLLSLEPRDPFTEDGPPERVILPVFIRNGVAGHTTGIEIAPTWDVRPWWRLRGSYARLHMDLHTRPGSADVTTPGQTEGSSPAHQATFRSGLALPGDLEFDLSYRYVSALPRFDVPAYSTADVRFAWHMNQNVEFSVVGRNLFRPHQPEFGVPATRVDVRRSVFGKVTFTR